MTTWAPKRFWTTVAVAETEAEGAFAVALDGRAIRTPAKTALILPTAALARAVAEEWRAQGDTIRPETMPMTRLANSALDRVAPEAAAVADIVASYGETDLLCYRADAPEELVRAQAEAWDPLLDWAEVACGARLVVTTGVVPVAQDPAALARLGAEVAQLSPWRLTALHELVSLTGSLVIGLAVEKGALPPDTAWERSRIDEEWQIAQWGRDEEAEARTAHRREEFGDAVRFLDLLGPAR